jgi:acyl-CoA synthetase (AMP-forming)/AMP-acid ligase II
MSPTADLAALLQRSFRHHAPGIAVEDGDRSETFAELDERSGRLGSGLLELNPHGRPVAILASNCMEYIESDIALIKAGQPKVPINTRLSQSERLHILNDSGATILITEAAFAESTASLADDAEDLTTIISVGGGGTHDYEDVLAAANRPPSRPWRPDDPSVILYTSGTTGRAKGATATFRSRMAATWNMLLDELTDVAAGDGMLHAGSLSHGSGSKVVAYALSGARNIVVPRFDPAAFLAEAERRRATASFVVPTMITMLVEEAESTGRTPPTLRHVSYGGSPIAPASLRRALEAFGPIFVQVYGTAEAPHPLSVLSQADHIDATESRLATAGKPTRSVELRLDSTDTVDVDEGEILVRAESIMTGYWNNKAANEEAFIDGFYRTGDVGRLDEDGYLTIIDRQKDMVISGGLNVYPAEVEAAIAGHPGVLESAVIGIPDDQWGERVVAYVVARNGWTILAEDITSHVAGQLAGYKKPRDVWIVDELPKGSTGKILKTELRREHWRSSSRQVN